MAASVAEILKRKGPSLTSEVIENLIAEGVSEATARQRVTRAQNQYVRLAGIHFAKGARFIYLADQFGTEEYWEALVRAFARSGQAYWAAFVGLSARGGRCPQDLFPTICGAPAARQRQLSPDRILDRLKAIHLLKEVEESGVTDRWIEFAPYFHISRSISEARAVLLAENVALFGIKEWARRLGFGSYGKFRIRGDEERPLVSGISWDLAAPSYVRPLVSAQSGTLKPGFIVCDVILGTVIDRDTVAAFVRKHDMASAPPGVAPIMPFFIADVFAEDAFALAKQKGIIAVTTEGLFGHEIAKALKGLIQLLSDAGATASVNPEYLETVLASLTRIEGAANNIRGALFELAVGALVKDVDDGFLETGLKWTDRTTGASAEIDVLLNRPGTRPLVIECKSKMPPAMVSLAEVQRWYNNRVPLIWEIMKQNPHYEDAEARF